MKAQNTFSAMAIMLLLGISLVLAQNGTITLNFSGDNNDQVVDLESVLVKNITQNCDTILYPPDLSIVLNTGSVGTSPSSKYKNHLKLSPNYPNPFIDRTLFRVFIPEPGVVDIMIYNLIGQCVSSFREDLKSGIHEFELTAGHERVYIARVWYKDELETISMLLAGSSGQRDCRINLCSYEATIPIKSAQTTGSFFYAPGDQLLFVGKHGEEESGIYDIPDANADYVLQFATNIPCIGMPAVDYGGQVYNTIQVYGQCWLKENLNVGEMIPSSQLQENNGMIEKYCMGDMQDGCDMFGGLYTWAEMMQFTTEPGGQGICPDGWHVARDIEWQILEGAVDSENGIGESNWGMTGWRGEDAGGHLKQTGTTMWMPPNAGATDNFGFCLLPAGYYVQNAFWGPGYKTYLWSSEYPNRYYRNVDWNKKKVRRDYAGNSAAFAVRCVKDL